MNSASPAPIKAWPKYYDTNFLYLPAPGVISILHRVSGAVMFLVLLALLPGLVWANLQRFFAGRAACALPFPRRHARPGDQRAPRQPFEYPYRLFGCHTIMHCVDVCPIGLTVPRPQFAT